MANLEDELGDIVSKARRGLNYTTDQLAHLTSMTGHDIQEIEAYRLTPDTERLRTLAEALSLDPEKLSAIASGAWEPSPLKLPQETAIVETIFVPYGAYGENCYILACPKTSAAAVVDPGGATDEILESLARNNLTLDLILITHAHGDHIGGVSDLISAFPSIRLAAHPLEAKSISLRDQAEFEAAKDASRITLGHLTIIALHTPGHTPGSTCYQVDEVCFAGDTLFAGSIGRPAGHEVYHRMLEDIREKVLSLPDAMVILPGHGPSSTVGEEKAHNPFF